MYKIYHLLTLFFLTIPFLQAQMPFQVQLQVDDQVNTLTVKLRNIENNQPTTSQYITSINMKLLGQVSDIISIANTNYSMLMPSTTPPNNQIITMSNTALQSPENWIINQWVSVVVYNLNPGTYSEASFSIQADLDGDNSDVEDPIMSVAAPGVFNIPLTLQSTILPIELLSFTADKINNNEALLTWKSKNEIAFDKFEIERAGEALHFQRIGIEFGKGNGTYKFMDDNPKIGKNYYRLKMVDLDGRYTYSKIKSLNFESQLQLSVHPNPSSTGEFSISLLGTKKSDQAEITIANTSGELIKSLHINEIEHNTYQINILDAPGIYYLRVAISNGQSFVEKLAIGL